MTPKPYRRIVFAALFLAVAAAAPGADSTSSETEKVSWFDQDTVTGDWGGLRDELADDGLTITSNYTVDFGGNPSGGLKHSTAYAGFLSVGTAFDFEKMASIEGLALKVSNYLASGSNLSASVGNFFGVQEIYTPGSYFFGELDLSLALLDDQVVFEAGRLFAGDVFATSHLWQYYVSSGVDNNLNSMPANIFFPTFNITAWAARATYQPDDHWVFHAGLYNADPRVGDPDRHGLFMGMDTDPGGLVISQLVYRHHLERNGDDLPGSLALGGYYQTSQFQDVSNPAVLHRGNEGFYLIFDQMVYRGAWPDDEGPTHLRAGATEAERAKQSYHPRTAAGMDRPKGLTVWAATYVAPDERINNQLYQIAGGLVYQGLPPNRDRDVTVLGVIVGKFNKEVNGQGTEMVLELNHRFQLCKWFYITPDIQYVIHPNGFSSIDDAVVLGLEASANF